MASWREGVYNSDYVVHLKGLIGQIKYECSVEPARLDEVCVEKYDNGDIILLFTTHPDATNDSKQGGIHARLAYNTLFQDLRNLSGKTDLEFLTSNQEVHSISARRGMERLLNQVLLCLEQYDNSLVEVSKKLRDFIKSEDDSVAVLENALSMQQSRVTLLKKVLNGKKGKRKGGKG